jgi:hypothetical protein
MNLANDLAHFTVTSHTFGFCHSYTCSFAVLDVYKFHPFPLTFLTAIHAIEFVFSHLLK